MLPLTERVFCCRGRKNRDRCEQASIPWTGSIRPKKDRRKHGSNGNVKLGYMDTGSSVFDIKKKIFGEKVQKMQTQTLIQLYT